MLVVVTAQPGANIIATVDRDQGALPLLQADLPPDIDMTVAVDRTTTIRASLQRRRADPGDRGRAGGRAWSSVFLRNVARHLIPSVAVPVSLLGTLRRDVPAAATASTTCR